MKKNYYPIILVLLGLFFYFSFLGKVHLFDWDEINFAESAREMIVTGDYTRVQINFQPFWEKPPLFFWLQVMSMKLFGINEYAARFPNAVFGILTLLSIYFVGKRWYNEKFGFIWALAYLGSFLPHLYFKSGIIDPVFNFFIFMSTIYMVRTVEEYGNKKSTGLAIISGIFIGLAILTKGPVGFLILMLAFLSFWGIKKFRNILSFKNIVLFGLSAGLVTLAWFGFELIKNGPWFLQEFITYQIRLFTIPDAGHKQPFYYHFVVVLIGCFPLSVLALRSFFYRDVTEKSANADLRLWMIILFWVVMILFTIVTTKIVHYSSMAYLPLSFLAAYHLFYLMEGKLNINRLTVIALYIIGSLMSLALIALPIVGLFKNSLIPYIKDKFAVGNLQAPVEWYFWEPLIGLAYLIAIVIGISYLSKKNYMKGAVTIFLSTAFCLWIYTALIVPKIEQFSQGAAIRFYESLQGQDVYVHTIGFKSYAHYFYFQKPANTKTYDQEWLTNGDIDKTVYFVSKNTKQQEIAEKFPKLVLLKEENGFLFYKREKE